MWKAEVRNKKEVILTIEDDGVKALATPPVSVRLSLGEAESLGSFLTEVAAQAKIPAAPAHKKPRRNRR